MNQQGLFWPSGRRLFNRRSPVLVRLGWGVVVATAAVAIGWTLLR